LITDYDMYLTIEKGIRGGVCMISKKYETSNKNYMKTYDKDKDYKYLMYLDANNLHGWVNVSDVAIC
jgi:hypothetical protein